VKEDRVTSQTVQAADAIAAEPIIKRLSDLKTAVGKELSDVSAKLEEETSRYNQMKSAIELKERELKEIFEIERNAYSLAALMEAQKQRKEEFEAEMEERQDLLETDIQQTRQQWQKEKQQYLEDLKEQKKEDEKLRKREKEEYEYNFKREQELAKAKLADEIAALEKELQKKKADFELTVTTKETALQKRESEVAEREKDIDDLQAKVASFPQELEDRINRAVADAVNSVKQAAQKNEELLKKGYEGEQNVLQTRIEGLEKTVASQKQQLEGLTRQLEKAYEKVQDIAVKAVSRSQPSDSAGQRPVINTEPNRSESRS
jgi:chromosome segregation ATPase